jgi:hypothetical protein
MPGKHSATEKRQAAHVAESERKRGMSAEDAESIGWATVNSRRKGKHAKKADSLAHVQGQFATAQSVVKPGGASKKVKPEVAHVNRQLATATSIKGVIPDRDTGRGVMAMSKKKPKLKKELPAGEAYPAMGKADEARSNVASSPAPARAPRVRGDKPTIKMKPITNEEAAANLRAGKHLTPGYEKAFRVVSLDEAAAAARDRSPSLLLKAAGLAPPPAHWKPRWHPPEMTAHYAVHGPLGDPKKKYKTKKRAQRAMDKLDLKYGATGHQVYAVPHETKKATPPPVPGSATRAAPGKPYLPGVHAPSDPARPKLGIAKPKVAKKAYPTMVASMSESDSDADKLQKPGTTASLMSSAKNRKVAKSQKLGHTFNSHTNATGAPMNANNLNDLFKSELEAGPAGDGAGKVLINCPHCEHPITKAEVIAKARGAGKEAHIEGEGSKATADAHVSKQNGEQGGPTRTKGKGMVEPARTGEGAMAAGKPEGEKRAADKVVGNQNSKGSTKKAMDDESSSEDGSVSKAQPAPAQGPVVRGSPWVQYWDSGEDARIAKAISEGQLGEQPIQPLDKHNRRG